MILIDRIVTLRSRSPCGERGLKYLLTEYNTVTGLSLPVRGAWIEIRGGWRVYMEISVAPRAGSVD